MTTPRTRLADRLLSALAHLAVAIIGAAAVSLVLNESGLEARMPHGAVPAAIGVAGIVAALAWMILPHGRAR